MTAGRDSGDSAEHAAPTAGWMVVETLARTGDAGEVTVVVRDGLPKDWTSLQRALRPKRVADAARILVGRVVADGRERAESIPVRDGSVCLRLIPVCGPSGAVHGVLVHVGPAGIAPATPPPRAAAYEWSAVERVFRFTPQMSMFLRDDRPRLTSTAPGLFEAVHDPESGMYLLTALIDARDGDRWDGTVAARTESGPLPLRNIVRTARVEADGEIDMVSRGLAVELRPDQLSSQGPSVEALALRSLTRSNPTSIALVDVAAVRVVRWLTEPVEGVQWKGEADRRDTPHPDDVLRLVESYRGMNDWDDNSAFLPGIRLRRQGGGWVVVDLRATRVPGQRFIMVEFQPTGTSTEPDPVPVTDRGYPRPLY
ncbi:GAF domain-containing protein [Rhodococcoides corynebacterioides]|uniref:GAF domain-containing protein n=1 Tax=Rhodococcoides corynebacterioides TaxID=53972 RepID=UPI003F7F689F